MRLKRTAAVAIAIVAMLGVLQPAATAEPPGQSPMTRAEFLARAHERGSLVTESAADHNCVRLLLERDPRQPNRLSSAGAFNVCSVSLWPSPWAFFQDAAAGIFVTTDTVPEVRPGDGIVYNFGPLGRYAPWGSQFCGQLNVPSSEGSAIFGPDCEII